MRCVVLEGYACNDCARRYLVVEAAGEDTVCPVCQSPASEFVGLYRIMQVDKKTTAAGVPMTECGD